MLHSRSRYSPVPYMETCDSAYKQPHVVYSLVNIISVSNITVIGRSLCNSVLSTVIHDSISKSFIQGCLPRFQLLLTILNENEKHPDTKQGDLQDSMR